MQYKLYVDRVFFLHFGIQFFLLFLTARMGGYRTGIRRLAGCAALGTMMFVGVLLVPMPGRGLSGLLVAGEGAVIFGKTLLFTVSNLVVIRMALKLRGKAALVRAGFLYIAAAFSLGGSLGGGYSITQLVTGNWGDAGSLASGRSAAASNTGSLWTVLFLAALATSAGIWLVSREGKRRKNPYFTATLREGEKQLVVTALADSGNSLFDPISGVPVCVAEKSVLEKLDLLEKPEKSRLIPYHSVGKQHGLLQAAVVEEMCLQKEGQQQKIPRVLLAASPQELSVGGRYQLLLHPALLENLQPVQPKTAGRTSDRDKAAGKIPKDYKKTKGADHDIESGDAGKDAV